jgi:hypothetical protein
LQCQANLCGKKQQPAMLTLCSRWHHRPHSLLLLLLA